MIRVNLLPHREEKRRARRQQFYALAGLVLALGAAIVFAVHSVIAGYISTQEAKNNFLKAEIAKLDTEIDEIKRLKEQTDSLLARKQVIESLQSNRAETVLFFNELAKQVPEGVYIRAVKQNGLTINIAGFAQSNARVSTLMRNLDASPLLEKPNLVEIKSAMQGTRRLSDFSLNITITRATPDDGKAVPKGSPAPAGGKKS
jgi:type IV pilus assembly protein PilN